MPFLRIPSSGVGRNLHSLSTSRHPVSCPHSRSRGFKECISQSTYQSVRVHYRHSLWSHNRRYRLSPSVWYLLWIRQWTPPIQPSTRVPIHTGSCLNSSSCRSLLRWFHDNRHIRLDYPWWFRIPLAFFHSIFTSHHVRTCGLRIRN